MYLTKLRWISEEGKGEEEIPLDEAPVKATEGLLKAGFVLGGNVEGSEDVAHCVATMKLLECFFQRKAELIKRFDDFVENGGAPLEIIFRDGAFFHFIEQEIGPVLRKLDIESQIVEILSGDEYEYLCKVITRDKTVMKYMSKYPEKHIKHLYKGKLPKFYKKGK